MCSSKPETLPSPSYTHVWQSDAYLLFVDDVAFLSILFSDYTHRCFLSHPLTFPPSSFLILACLCIHFHCFPHCFHPFSLPPCVPLLLLHISLHLHPHHHHCISSSLFPFVLLFSPSPPVSIPASWLSHTHTHTHSQLYGGPCSQRSVQGYSHELLFVIVWV